MSHVCFISYEDMINHIPCSHPPRSRPYPLGELLVLGALRPVVEIGVEDERRVALAIRIRLVLSVATGVVPHPPRAVLSQVRDAAMHLVIQVPATSHHRGTRRQTSGAGGGVFDAAYSSPPGLLRKCIEMVSCRGLWYMPFVEMHPMFIARSLMRT